MKRAIVVIAFLTAPAALVGCSERTEDRLKETGEAAGETLESAGEDVRRGAEHVEEEAQELDEKVERERRQ